MPTTLETLQSAHSMLSVASRWTPWAGALDDTGTRLPSGHASETRFSALSAIERAALGSDPAPAIRAVYDALPWGEPLWSCYRTTRADPRCVLLIYNSEVRHADVVALFDRAISCEWRLITGEDCPGATGRKGAGTLHHWNMPAPSHSALVRTL